MCVGQHAEMVRQKLEKVDVVGDLEAFIATSGTGAEKPGLILLTRVYHSNHKQ